MDVARVLGGAACCSGLLIMVLFVWAACVIAGRADRMVDK
jgi:hypothetical protein